MCGSAAHNHGLLFQHAGHSMQVATWQLGTLYMSHEEAAPMISVFRCCCRLRKPGERICLNGCQPDAILMFVECMCCTGTQPPQDLLELSLYAVYLSVVSTAVCKQPWVVASKPYSLQLSTGYAYAKLARGAPATGQRL